MKRDPGAILVDFSVFKYTLLKILLKIFFQGAEYQQTPLESTEMCSNSGKKKKIVRNRPHIFR